MIFITGAGVSVSVGVGVGVDVGWVWEGSGRKLHHICEVYTWNIVAGMVMLIISNGESRR